MFCSRKATVRQSTWASTNSRHGCVRIGGVFSVIGWKAAPVHGPDGVTGGETSHSQLSHRAGNISKEDHIEFACYFTFKLVTLRHVCLIIFVFMNFLFFF